MLDIKQIRENPAAFDEGIGRRGLPAQSAELLKLDELRRSRLTEVQNLQSRRNQIAKEIGMAKKNGEDSSALQKEAGDVNAKIAELEAKSGGDELDEALLRIPNIPDTEVPLGKDENDNKQVREWGERPKFDFKPKEHFELGEALGMMDFERAAKMSGARFVALTAALARLERALANFMLDCHSREFGYTEVVPPYMVRDNALFGTGQLPKFSEDLFKVGEELWLIPTAEVPLTNLISGEILDAGKLPLRYTAYSPCFRSEAGSAGKDTRGMIRQHQFTKVELVSITAPEQSEDEHERMTAAAENILKKLGLPYRVMLLCTGDMGFSAKKTYDIEVWLPGQDRYREISSCSNCGDFQARRMKARFRAQGEKETKFVHTLNGSGLAVGRTMVAVLENYQQADGSIKVPEALKPYMGGLEVINAAK